MLKLIWLIRDRNEWKRRAASLEAKLEAERSRQDRFAREVVSRFATISGAMGIAPEAKPRKEIPASPEPATPQSIGDFIRNLPNDMADTLETYFEDARANGINENQAFSDFFNREYLSKMPILESDQQN